MMTYLLFIAVGILGILAANLIEIDQMEKASDGNANLVKYWKMNWANIALSLCMVLAAIVGKNYITGLELAGKSLALGIFAIGMAGPMVARFVRDKTVTYLGNKTSTNIQRPNDPVN